jgi:hypothetical protein
MTIHCTQGQGREKVFDESLIAIAIFFEKKNIEVASTASAQESRSTTHSQIMSDIPDETASLVTRACHMVTLST